MFLMFIVLLIMSFVFFKLGVYSVLVAMFQGLFQVLMVVSGAFIVYFVWKKVTTRRCGQIEVQ
jgi:threonine/homoserine/homoserine lactone efflux protein